MAYTQSYEIELNRDPNTGEPILVYISNIPHVVKDNQVVLGQIPSETAQIRVQITDMSEIAKQELITTSTQFKVDYDNGVVYFHSSKENSTVNISYYGKGMKLLYDDRIIVRNMNDKLSNIFNKIQSALNGDLFLNITPVTLGSSATTVNSAINGVGTKFTRNIELSLRSSNGTLHNWYQGKMNIIATKVSTSGLVTIAGGLTQTTFINGVATVTLEYTGTWATSDICTLTVIGGNLLGYTIANKTSVDTLVA